MQVMLETTWVWIPWKAGVPVQKVYYHSVNHQALFHTFHGLSHIVECSRKHKGNQKRHSDSCRPAWLEMDWKVCPTTATSYTKEVELLVITTAAEHATTCTAVWTHTICITVPLLNLPLFVMEFGDTLSVLLYHYWTCHYLWCNLETHYLYYCPATELAAICDAVWRHTICITVPLLNLPLFVILTQNQIHSRSTFTAEW